MHIHWNALGQVALVSLLFGVGLAIVFALGVTAMSRRAVAIEEKKPPRSWTPPWPRSASRPAWQRCSTGCI